MRVLSRKVIVIGSGAAGLAAALRLKSSGADEVALYTEGLNKGTSINTGSDKQTYYKLGMDGFREDSPVTMARDMCAGGGAHGDIALVEASVSPMAFAGLVSLGVAFPHDRFGRFTGYKTDHDPCRRATSTGPYTSRDMCLKLIDAVKRSGVEIVENSVAVKLICTEEPGGACGGSGKRIAGVVFADLNAKSAENGFYAVASQYVVFAAGGPGGIYGRSVYPGCHTGGIGLAMAEGTECRGLAESQYGIASVKFRWNVSGSYMQVVPRIYSVDENGVEREFLSSAFGSCADACNMTFLKGYQWPFSAERCAASSRIDMEVYAQTVLLGRRVFLDYRRNPSGWNFGALGAEAAEYLEKCGAAGGETPFDRLLEMNPGAAALYREHGIRLESEPLEIAVCAQHNNGGLCGDIWWQSTNIRGLYPVGEVNGSHGISRPGGTALNAGQVGAWRAAESITWRMRNSPAERCGTEELVRAESEAFYRGIEDSILRTNAVPWGDMRAAIMRRMDKFGGFVRAPEAIRRELAIARAEYLQFAGDGLGGLDFREIVETLRTRSLCLTHLTYLEAAAVQGERSGSRGGSIIVAGGAVMDADPGSWEIVPEKDDTRSEVMVCTTDRSGNFKYYFEKCRPVPDNAGWFESVWKDFASGKVYSEESE